MSVTFQNKLNITNKAAYELLKHIGHDMGPYTNGEMAVSEARIRINEAKVCETDHPRFFDDLDRIVAELEAAGVATLEWC